MKNQFKKRKLKDFLKTEANIYMEKIVFAADSYLFVNTGSLLWKNKH